MVTKDIEYFSNVNLKGNEMIEARVENVSALPAFSEGRIVYLTTDTDENTKAGFYYSTANAWIRVTIKSETDDIIADVKALQDAIGSTDGSGTVLARITALETTVNGAGETTGLVAKVTTLESKVKTIEDTTIPGVLSKAQSALDKATANETAIGSDTTPDSVKYRIKTLETTMASEQTNIDKLQETVGDASSGLVKRVGTLEGQVGTKAVEGGAAATGLYKDIADIKTDLGTKVDKVEGKQLSTEDYTTAEKTKLGGIAEGAQVNKIENVKVKTTTDGEYSALAITDKAVSLDLSGYALKSQIPAAINWKGSVANKAARPSSGNTIGDMYHVEDTKAEYIWNGTSWEFVGQIVNLEPYSTTEQMNSAISGAVSTAKTELTTEINKKANDAGLATVAKSGKYSDLTGTPVVDTVLNSTSGNAIANKSVYDALAGKVDKLVNKPVTQDTTFTKVTINSEGQVTAGANLTADDIPALAHTKITDFESASISAGKKVFSNVSMTVSSDWQDVSTTVLSEYPSAITAYDSEGKVIGVALRYYSGKVQYCVNTAVSGVTVVVSL